MAIDPLDLLEKRVHQLLEMLTRMKQDNSVLEKKVRVIGQKLSKRERDTVRWNHDRVRLRAKVERILGEMGAQSSSARPAGGEGARPRKRGDA